MSENMNLTIQSDPDLMNRVNLIADRLLKDMPDQAEPGQQHALLERVLVYAAEAEQKLADREQRIAYLQDLSLTDELTGLLNRRGFVENFARALASARRFGHEGMLLYCDLDDFKSVNDQFGHAAGDAMLRHAARVLKESVREIDIVSRLGGDEFAVALLQSSWRNGTKRARTVQYRLESGEFTFENTSIPMRVSIGCEPFGPDDQIDDLICRADMAMYCIKRRRADIVNQIAAE
jgi:diguanylate cyclase (GGDEF)-like protein